MINSNWLRSVKFNAKNLIGWSTRRKIIVFSVDDYGNVRIDSRAARSRLTAAGISVKNRFDAYDTLETSNDLNHLFETLRTVRDRNNRHAVFTPYAVPCNIDFEQMQEAGNQEYIYELLPQTFEKKSSCDPANYASAWQLWNQGMDEELLAPQFHGREHLNVKVFEEKLLQENPELLIQLQNRSFTHISNSGYETVSALAAFEFWDFEENKRFKEIIRDGLNKFEKVFEYRARHFTPPVYSAHPVLYDALKKDGIRFVDTALIANQHQGRGDFKKQFNYTGKQQNGLHLMVRNVIFEPTADSSINWPAYAMQQIEAAFRWNRPAVISSHRVNFCGHIDNKNRAKGLDSLRSLLHKITSRWPDVEFMSADELGALIQPV